MKYTQIVYEVKPQTFHFVGRSGPLGNSEIRSVHLIVGQRKLGFLWSVDASKRISFRNCYAELKVFLSDSFRKSMFEIWETKWAKGAYTLFYNHTIIFI